MKDLFNLVAEIIFCQLFFVLFMASVVAVVYGAWWHIFTSVVSFALCYYVALEIKGYTDAKKNTIKKEDPSKGQDSAKEAYTA